VDVQPVDFRPPSPVSGVQTVSGFGSMSNTYAPAGSTRSVGVRLLALSVGPVPSAVELGRLAERAVVLDRVDRTAPEV
jgi:hypothetical protein